MARPVDRSEKTTLPSAFGQRLKQWRQTRGLTQLQLAVNTEISQRHISFLETGRSRPGAAMIGRLAEALDLPLREQNHLLALAGLPPRFPELALGEGPSAIFVDAIHRTIEAHEPYPAIVVDGWWDVKAMNRPAQRLFPALRSANLVTAIFEPGPLRDALENWSEVAQATFSRLAREAARSPFEPRLQRLCDLARARLTEEATLGPIDEERRPIAVMPTFRLGDRVVRMFSMVAEFSAVHEITLNELRVELLFPRDKEDAEVLVALSE